MNEILSHLKNNPEFRKINTQETIQNFIELLPLKLKKRNKICLYKATNIILCINPPCL